MSRVTIQKATIRDYTFIATNMRDMDAIEIMCQLPDEMGVGDVAWMSILGREAWQAKLDGQPVAAFGVHDVGPSKNILSIWAWGTKRMPRVVPAISRHMVGRVPEWLESGITRVEARSIVSHTEAHRWMEKFGAQRQMLRNWGKAGEDFYLFAWTKGDFTEV